MVRWFLRRVFVGVLWVARQVVWFPEFTVDVWWLYKTANVLFSAVS